MRWMLQSNGKGCVLTFVHKSPSAEQLPNSVISGWHEMFERVDNALLGEPKSSHVATQARLKELYDYDESKRNLPMVEG
jgi:hypothetical protein